MKLEGTDTEKSVDEVETVETVETVEDSKPDLPASPAADFDSALTKALESGKEETKESEAPKETAAKGRNEKGQFLKGEQKQTKTPETKEETETVEPPAEFSQAAKEAFKKGDLKTVQAEYTRIMKSRTQEMSRVQNEHQSVKQLAQVMMPYIETVAGQGKDPYRAITEAIGVIAEINKDPYKALKEIAEVKGIKITIEGEPKENGHHPEITSLRDEVSQLKNKQATAELQQLGQMFGQVFETMQKETNKAGSQRFADLTDDEAGLARAGQIGSLIRSQDFQRAVQARIPGAGLRDYVEQAYRWFGFRVDDSEPSRSQASNHIQKANRAAASVPGRGVANAVPNRKKGDWDHAINAALEELET